MFASADIRCAQGRTLDVRKGGHWMCARALLQGASWRPSGRSHCTKRPRRNSLITTRYRCSPQACRGRHPCPCQAPGGSHSCCLTSLPFPTHPPSVPARASRRPARPPSRGFSARRLRATEEQRSQGLDIADFLLMEDTPQMILQKMIDRRPLLYRRSLTGLVWN